MGAENLLDDVVTEPVDRLEVSQQLQLVIKAAGALEGTAEHPLPIIHITFLIIFTGMLPILFWYVLV